jgi:hypothetical protein
MRIILYTEYSIEIEQIGVVVSFIFVFGMHSILNVNVTSYTD